LIHIKGNDVEHRYSSSVSPWGILHQEIISVMIDFFDRSGCAVLG